jgi:hypothetical protein
MKTFDVDRVSGVEKESEEGKNEIKTNVLVPNIAVVRKEEGATVDLSAILSPTFSQRADATVVRKRAVRQ